MTDVKKSPSSTLADILAKSKAAAGTLPAINPPQAASVLATKTAAEVAGEEVEELPPAVVPAPVPKPADVVAAEQAPKTRRTAAVVQAELDEANAKIAELLAADTEGSSVDGALSAQLVSAESALEEKGRECDALKEKISRLEQVCQDAKEELSAASTDIEARADKIAALTEANNTLLQELQDQTAVLDQAAEKINELTAALEGATPAGAESSTEDLIDALTSRGLALTVSYPAKVAK